MPCHVEPAFRVSSEPMGAMTGAVSAMTAPHAIRLARTGSDSLPCRSRGTPEIAGLEPERRSRLARLLLLPGR